MLDPEVKRDLQRYYNVDTHVEVAPRTALYLGHALTRAGYKKVQSYVPINGPNPTVRTALAEFANSPRYVKSTNVEIINQNGGIVGPYYSELGEGETFCPEGGIAVWYPAET